MFHIKDKPVSSSQSKLATGRMYTFLRYVPCYNKIISNIFRENNEEQQNELSDVESENPHLSKKKKFKSSDQNGSKGINGSKKKIKSLIVNCAIKH